VKNRVRRLRLEAGLSQVELAARAGLATSTLHRIDANPRVKVSLEQASRLAPPLGVQPMDLLPRIR
jgi:DNA-binding XRE family transcriptional regulator